MAFAGTPAPAPATRAQRRAAHASRCAVRMNANGYDAGRRAVVGGVVAAALAAVVPDARAKTLTLSGDYKTDAAALVEKMKEVSDMKRGTPGMAEAVSSTRTMMNDFVAYYRRNSKVSGSLSFNTLYTAVNTLSGHYASYGPNYPVPEKRKKRLEQQYLEVERAIARGR